MLLAWAGTPSLEKERGAFWVQYSILHAMNDPEGLAAAGMKDKVALRHALVVLERGGQRAYDMIVGKNLFYNFWPDTIWPGVDTSRWFPLSF